MPLENGKSKESAKHVESIAGALSVLDAFETHGSLSLKELNALTGMNKSRIMRIAGTLEHYGYLSYSHDTHAYELGARIHSLARHASPMRENLKRILKPYMESIACETGETASFFVIAGRTRLCLLRRESDRSVRFVIQEGQERPLHKGAPSKVLLAFAPDDMREAILNDENFLQAMNRDGLCVSSLREEIARVRSAGYACTAEEVSSEVFSICVPVCHKNGKLCGALAVSGPLYRLTEENRERVMVTLRKYRPLIEMEIP